MNNMSRTAKILLGVGTFFPLAYVVFFLLFIIFMFAYIPLAPQTGPMDGPPPFIFVIFPLHILAMLTTLGLTIFYVVHLINTTRIPNDQKALWAVILILGSMIAMPVYWYLYIWREPARTPETTTFINVPPSEPR